MGKTEGQANGNGGTGTLFSLSENNVPVPPFLPVPRFPPFEMSGES
ncbi:hypothetical protein DSOL_0885 [Desulfosporosinus metallidurans]|uniref:Uncharacterized protein n=1 Tax=Desulfosporosinus metallidurans TaxID=1888891 RepID=A0A1Q8R0K2_9FIRM|nr:hypothetical protein DSOL_0885 [Desulfosporosinus metallidurans]